MSSSGRLARVRARATPVSPPSRPPVAAGRAGCGSPRPARRFSRRCWCGVPRLWQAASPSQRGSRSSTCLRPATALAAGLKWPNDVLVDGRKLAGILCEVEPAAGEDRRIAVALGLGVNLRVESFDDDVQGVSLHTLVATPPGAEELLMAWGAALRHPNRHARAGRDRRAPDRLAPPRGRPGRTGVRAGSDGDASAVWRSTWMTTARSSWRRQVRRIGFSPGTCISAPRRLMGTAVPLRDQRR